MIYDCLPWRNIMQTFWFDISDGLYIFTLVTDIFSLYTSIVVLNQRQFDKTLKDGWCSIIKDCLVNEVTSLFYLVIKGNIVDFINLCHKFSCKKQSLRHSYGVCRFRKINNGKKILKSMSIFTPFFQMIRRIFT
jgi:hypothetical protein